MTTTSDMAPPAGDERAVALGARVALRALVECCRVLEEGVAGARDIDAGMANGGGIVPPPFQLADQMGLDNVLAGLDHACREWGDSFQPPVILRRLVAQGRLGVKTGQGFYPYPRPDEGVEQTENVLLETRGRVAIAWLNRAPVNSLAPELIADLMTVWRRVEDDDDLRVLVIASATALFSAGADLKAFSRLDAAGAAAYVDGVHELFNAFERGRTPTIAAVNGMALGGGLELALACDLRLAGESATFALPEITLGIMPGFGGTRRLPRLVGLSAANEMMFTGDAIDAPSAHMIGLVNEVTPDQELFDTVLATAARLAERAPVAVAQIKAACADLGLDEGIAAERRAFATALSSEDGREGVAAFFAKRRPEFKGR